MCRHGGWDEARAAAALRLLTRLYDGNRSAIVRGFTRMSEQELAGKVAIVTGAGRNIGRAIALALAHAGAAVVVNVRSNQAEADAVVREIEAAGGKAAAHVGDVADPKAAAAMAALALEQFGRIDILVNNAALRGETADRRR